MSKNPETSSYRTSEKFRKLILELIYEKGCNKTDFAKLVHVNPSIISHAILYSIIPSVRSLIKIADSLGYTVSYVLGESDDPAFYPAAKRTTFHDRLPELTNEKKTTYSEISGAMTFPRNAIYEWLRLKTFPSLEYLQDLAKHFKVSIDYLLGRTDVRN